MKWSDFLVKPTKYSNFDLSTTKRMSATYGVLYPVWHRIMNPGETFSIDMRHLIRTNPVESPLMGRFKVRFCTVVSNLKNYCVGLEGYRRSFDWRTFQLPTYRMPVTNVNSDSWIINVDNVTIDGVQYTGGERSVVPWYAVRETSLADYLGFERGWLPTNQQYSVSKDLSFIPFAVYYDFYRNYMVNPQDGYFPRFVSLKEYNVRGDGSTIDIVPQSYVHMYPIAELDNFFSQMHKFYDGEVSNSDGHVINIPDQKFVNSYLNEREFKWVSNPSFYDQSVGTRCNDFSSYHGGLCATMFDPDINTQWLSVSNYDRLQEVKVNTQSQSGATFSSFSDIVKASSLWDFVSREIYNGGTYFDHIYSQFGVSVRGDMNIPQIVHVYDSMISFEDITSQSDTAQGSGDTATGAVVGQQFGVGRGYGQGSRFKIRNTDNNYAWVMTFMWITPLADYNNGLSDEFNLTKFSDLYTPAFDNYSMQPRLQEQLYAGLTMVDNADPFDPDARLNVKGANANTTIGYQPAYSQYKTDVNTLHGLMRNQLSYWAIVRKASRLVSESNLYSRPLSTYVWTSNRGVYTKDIDACNVEVPFSVVNEDNFQVQLRFDVVATRPMSKSVMPHVK